MDDVEKKWLVLGTVLLLIAVIPTGVLAAGTPNGQPFQEIWAEMENHQVQIEAETAARIAGDTALLEALNAEEAARIAADSALQAGLDAEEAARIAGDVALQAGLDAEEAARINGDDSLQAALDAEEAARIAGDDSLQDALDAEIAARIAGDNALQAGLDAEEAARIAADTALQAGLDAEEAARIAADTALQAGLDAEEAARIAADAALQADLDDLAALDALDYDSLADLEAAMANGVDLATTSGGVGIGTTNPSGKLEVVTGNLFAPQVLDQSQTKSGYYSGGWRDSWQEFKAGKTGKLEKVSLYISTLSNPTETIRIYSGRGTGGTLLYTSPTLSGIKYTWMTHTLTTPVDVVSGSKYTIRLTATSGAGNYWGMGIGNPYPAGKCSLTHLSWDHMFKTYVSPLVPELIVSTSGNVGIGTLNPTQQLHVAGNVRIEGALYDSVDQPGTNGQILQSTGTGIGWADSAWTISGNNMYSAVSGNVGIGTTTPATKLDVNGKISAKNMPGIEHTGWDYDYDDVPKTWTNIRSVALTVNSPGYILVTFSGTVDIDTGGSKVTLGIDTTKTNYDTRMYVDGQSSADRVPFSVQYVYYVWSGTYTFYGNAMCENGNSDILNARMTAVYLPVRY
jgi:hypothetical protein